MTLIVSNTLKAVAYTLLILFGLQSSSGFTESGNSQSKQVNLANTLLSAFNQYDSELLCSVIDFETLGIRSAEKIFEKKIERDAFLNGFIKTSDRSCRQIIKNIKTANGSAKLLRTTKVKNDDRILIRLDLGDLGFDYLEFITRTVTNGSYRVVDWYQLTSGQLVSDTMGGIARMVIDPNPSLLKRMLGANQINKEAMNQIQMMVSLISKGKSTEAYDAFTSLPESLKSKRLLILFGIGAASRTGDDEKYKESLALLAKYHSDDPSAAVMLIDYYFYQGAWDKVLSAIDTIESRFGNDAMLELLRANVFLSKNVDPKFEYHAKNAIAMESDFIDAYFTLINGYVSKKNYEQMIKVFDQMMSRFEYQLKKEDFYEEPLYSDFVKSKAFKEWRLTSVSN
jgi:pentatricopeptide repeat protein